MPVPMPKSEIHVQTLSDQYLRIRTVSSDAIAWLENHAPAFGLLYRDSPDKFALMVNPNYDIEEVAAYIRALGQEEEKEQP